MHEIPRKVIATIDIDWAVEQRGERLKYIAVKSLYLCLSLTPRAVQEGEHELADAHDGCLGHYGDDQFTHWV